MSVQRYAVFYKDGSILPTDDGGWVRYADHERALAEARADERQQARQRVEGKAAAMYAPPRALMFIDAAAAAAGGES